MNGDVTCVEIAFQILIDAGPGDRKDRDSLVDLLTRKRTVEPAQFHNYLHRWQYAMTRLDKYGMALPDPSILYGILLAAAEKT